MKKLLLLGSDGFVGKNIIGILRKNFDVLCPDRFELDLRNFKSVQSYFENNDVEIVCNCANPNPIKYKEDTKDSFLKDSILMFLNLYNCRNLYGKMFYLGSGAEYNKSFDIINVSEDCLQGIIPNDEYGFAKYVMNALASSTNNIYNFCLFGCYGPYDHESKFITHCIRSILNDENITIKQDCKFDYIHIYDLASYIVWGANNELKFHKYNISGNNHIYLSDIARIVIDEMKSDKKIIILKDGFNNEYTCNGNRLFEESGILPSISLTEGIKKQIEFEKGHINYEKKSS